MNSNVRRAFTLIELLVVVSIIALLIGLLVPSLGVARENSRRVSCASNLAGIGKSMTVYAYQERTYPSVVSPTLTPTVSKLGKWTLVTPSAGGDPIAYLYTNRGSGALPSYPAVGEPMANLWLLVLLQLQKPKAFICPSDPTWPGVSDVTYAPPDFPAAGTYCNFGISNESLMNTYSYSFAYPWVASSSMPAPWWQPAGAGGFVLGADIGPTATGGNDDPKAGPGKSASNSKNHGGLGENVVFKDCHVEYTTRNNVGLGGGNIYVGDGGNIVVKTGGKALSTLVNLNADPGGMGAILAPARP